MRHLDNLEVPRDTVVIIHAMCTIEIPSKLWNPRSTVVVYTTPIINDRHVTPAPVRLGNKG